MIIRTYKELEEYVEMFKKQNCDLLIIQSKAGYGKSTLVKKMMKETDYVYINTHSTPLSTYLTLYEKQDCPVVFDDIDSLMKSDIMVSMLKALADTNPIKELHYSSTSKLLCNAPSSFKTTSVVCMLLNEFDSNNKAIAPLLDRGFFIQFQPDRKEILEYLKEVSKSQSLTVSEKCVYKFMEENYNKIPDLSLRTYVKALQLFRNDENTWKEKFMRLIGFDEKLVEYLKLQDLYKTDKERIENFKWSRATYFRVAQEVRGEI